ncbi:hypothetical protein ACIQNG_12955 [Streptomyces sp. NPDC091377]|uniref:hypothetical protein n=1 Tax=Streptomyces sp. NPDC091377 TaxID=3365995 RepID=UPI0038059EB7
MKMRHLLAVLFVTLAVACGVQFAVASPGAEVAEPSTETSGQQFALPHVPTPLRAQVLAPLETGGVTKEQNVDANRNSSSPQVTYGLSQALKNNATLSELVKKGACVWNKALGTPCDSSASFLVEGVQPFSSGPRAGIEIDAEDLGPSTRGSASTGCSATECKSFMSLSTTLLKNDTDGVRTVVHEFGHTFSLDHGVESDSLFVTSSNTFWKSTLWADCRAVMAYRDFNCSGTPLTDTPTDYETECVKSVYKFTTAQSGPACQVSPLIGRTTSEADGSVKVAVSYKCDDVDLRSLEVSVTQAPSKATGSASVRVTCDGNPQIASVNVISTRTAFGTGKTGVTAHLVDVTGKVKGSSAFRDMNSIPSAG